MPRKKGNKQTKQSSPTLATPVLFAKCTGCQVNGELKACEFCQYPECVACIVKHREADKISQTKAMFETKIDSLRKQTVLKYETLKRSIDTMTTSLDLLKTTKDMYEHTLMVEYDAYKQKLQQSQTINKQYIDDLKHMWTEFEKNTITSVENCEQIDHIMDQIEASLTKKHIQLCFQPNVVISSIGSLNESLPDSVTPNLVQIREQSSDVQLSLLSSDPGTAAQFSNVDHSPPSVPFVEANKSKNIETNINGSLGNLNPVLMEQQRLSKSQKRRQSEKRRRVDNANKSLTPTESNISVETTTTTTSMESYTSTGQNVSAEADASTGAVVAVTTPLNFNRFQTRPRTSVNIREGQRMASNDEYFLVCPKNRLKLLDTQGKEHLNIPRDFKVSDICWSTYLKQFLILSDKDLYSLDLSRKTPLMIEISQFARDMDECTCYDNIFMTISDFGGSIIEVWDMKMNWKLIKHYDPPISRKQGQGISSIRFSSSGMYLGVTLTQPFIQEAYFQLRNWKDMTVLHTVEQPFYEGYCNHYMLALPNDEFLVYKYSEKEMFFFHSNGERKQTIRYNKGICSTALIMNNKNCLVIQTRRPDDLYFYDL